MLEIVFAAACTVFASDLPSPAVLVPRGASSLETLAAREVHRYVYLRTGRLLPVLEAPQEIPEGWRGILVARGDRPALEAVGGSPPVAQVARSLEADEHLLKTLARPRGRVVVLTGGSDASTLHAAYRFAELLGVRFYLHGDVVPDEKARFRLPRLDERAKPLFDLRGIQPFHDFPEGPDWWDLDDYKVVISQLPKLRMNFIGLHTYPEGGPNAEPTVWIGPPEEIGEGTAVKASYPSSYQNTLRGNWGYAAKRTGDFSFGAAALFQRDDYGPEVMRDACPQPATPEDSNAVFRRTADMLGAAFRHARALGVKTCVGTETPLTVPKKLRERLHADGRDVADPAVLEDLYKGIFLRAAQAYPIDYYWFWTPEGWTWQGASSDVVKRTLSDLQTAIEAWNEAGVPFRLATCGWVLGPQDDRALFDGRLPPGMAVSCINRQVGNEPVDPAFARVRHRPKWAIPWLEDDPGLTAPQLWVGRMRRDAADALRYGCSGLMGIHWRTRILGPNVLALAWAAWDQEPWGSARAAGASPEETEGPVGGQVARFDGQAIEGTDDDPVYRTVRYSLQAYRFQVPAGSYRVVLKFCEPHYAEAGKRVFGVDIEGKPVIEDLDIFALAGKNRAIDYAFADVRVDDGWLDVDFVAGVEYPSIAALVLEGQGVTRRINCGGTAHGEYEADWSAAPLPKDSLPTEDFYRDWAVAEFGPEAGPAAAELFVALDGSLPRPADWVDGPGGIRPDPRAWDEVAREYEFVDRMAELRPRVSGDGSAERFEYWLGNFRYLRAMGRVRCVWAQFQAALEGAKAEKDSERRGRLAREVVLPLRRDLVAATADVYANLLETVTNPGEMGTVANWEQHILPSLLENPGRELRALLGGDLPADAIPSTEYRGRDRVIVPTVRTSVAEGEVLRLKVIVLARRPHREGAILWRPLGAPDWERTPLLPIARGVHEARFPPSGASGDVLEYHVEVRTAEGESIRFPSTAPSVGQTLVVVPAEERRL